ncbi:HAMP domain-containing sensor histidine kinase [Mucilaginibacter sp.]|uniref:sensor histidine kinase n=1 Tax=Mucilaginibacter sp. TaxID=1882438 RepID=UPI0025F82BDF|nr:HAMP domain-containing sensor histidine kinase [Mucilaginibacter sp.]
MNNNQLAAILGWRKYVEHSNDRIPDRGDNIMYRFRLLFYTGCGVSVVLVVVLGLISYMHLSQLQATTARTGLQSGALRQIKLFVTAGTAMVLMIVAFLVYIVLNELKSRSRAYQHEHQLNKLKSNFITLASHEFRTPLSSVMLSAALIEKYAQKQETENIVKHSLKIKTVVHRLEVILDDFLSLEKLDAGRVMASAVSFDLDTLCRETMEEVCFMGKPGQQFSYEQTGNVGMVGLDQELIRKALTNLLFNAVKYAGEQAHIWLLLQITEEWITISVKDNGTGIAEKDQHQLFTIFHRVDDSGNIPGTGLGLHIVKRYVQLMGGTLHFYSRPQDETCFEMTFPVSR